MHMYESFDSSLYSVSLKLFCAVRCLVLPNVVGRPGTTVQMMRKLWMSLVVF